MKNKPSILTIILPGILVAATGVGAGDLATASFAGSQLGTSILWAVVIGGIFKFVLTEGLTRWQLATGETFLEGCISRLGSVFTYIFLPYMILWSFFVGSALISASGVALHALVPIFDNAATAKVIFGILSSVLGLIMVMSGNFKTFERLMACFTGLMFVIVSVTAIVLWPGFSEVLSGLFIPTIPKLKTTGLSWTVALIGGVGGTLTILCYGYWIKEKGRNSIEDLKTCRLDLAVGYSMTVLFGLAMVIIGSSVDVSGKGSRLLVILADRLQEPMGLTGRYLFLFGAFSAIFSSLLGVWQAVPYLFADIWKIAFDKKNKITIENITESRPYKYYMIAIAIIPMLSLFTSFKEIQKIYAIIGSTFIPILAIGLLYFNSKKEFLGKNSNGAITIALLLTTLVFFGYVAFIKFS